jgi:DNA-binding NarL/FixJ family response regulator
MPLVCDALDFAAVCTGLQESALLPIQTAPVPLRLVLIEDHQALREGLELLLGREGCDVVGTAGTAREGRALIASLDPDVALVDIRLGEESGIDLTRAVIDADPSCRIVLYTGSSDVELLISGLDSGARGYALKEGTPSELTSALATVAGGGTYVDPRLRPSLLSRRTTQRMPSLSKREREIMDLLAQGLTGEQVAERLVLSSETVKTHIRNAMTKLEASTRVHAIAIALREGFIQPHASAGDDGQPPAAGVP